MIELLKQNIAVTLSHVVQSLGPMSEHHGSFVKKIISGTDDVAFMALGCYLDDCIKSKSYTHLDKAMEDIPH